MFTFWVDNEALDRAGLQLPVNKVIQRLHRQLPYSGSAVCLAGCCNAEAELGIMLIMQ